jgi:hypothetical protein
MDRVVIVRQRGDATQLEHTPRVVDGAMVKEVENYCAGYRGDDLLHDLELQFPHLSFRDFFIGFRRWQAAERMLREVKA